MTLDYNMTLGSLLLAWIRLCVSQAKQRDTGSPEATRMTELAIQPSRRLRLAPEVVAREHCSSPCHSWLQGLIRASSLDFISKHGCKASMAFDSVNGNKVDYYEAFQLRMSAQSVFRGNDSATTFCQLILRSSEKGYLFPPNSSYKYAGQQH